MVRLSQSRSPWSVPGPAPFSAGISGWAPARVSDQRVKSAFLDFVRLVVNGRAADSKLAHWSVRLGGAMTPPLFATQLCLSMAACVAGNEPTVPPCAGSITTRSFTTVADHVYGNITVATGPACEQQVVFWIDSRTTRLVRRDGGMIGHSVSVEYRGGTALSCPAQTGAEAVILER
jgi:hypothetical protein